MKKVMKMQLFGKFSLMDQDIVLDEEEIRSASLTRLLTYMILFRNAPVSRQKLIETFWTEEERNRDLTGALKNLFYRLRSVLRVFGPEEYICSYRGAYQWNPEIRVETDYEEFEELAAQVRRQSEMEQKRGFLERMIRLYRGNASPNIADELWLVSRLTRYQSLYLEAAHTLCAIYTQAQEWDLLEELCRAALQVDDLDEELHGYMMRSLYARKKMDLVRRHYEETRKLLYDRLGIQTPERLQEVYQELMSESDETEANISRVLQEVREPERPRGAYFCEYSIFQQIYRVEARRIRRLGIAEYVMLVTLREMRKNGSTETEIAEGMQLLGALLRSSLRLGDVISRCGASQYIVLLPGCTYESGELVIGRIRHGFREQAREKELELLCELEEISETK